MPLPSTTQKGCPWNAGWAVGPHGAQLSHLWRKIRQQNALGTDRGDAAAEDLLEQIRALIDEHSRESLRDWSTRMQDRSAAAKWVKASCEVADEPSHQIQWDGPMDSHLDDLTLSLEEQHLRTARELADRWNVGPL